MADEPKVNVGVDVKADVKADLTEIAGQLLEKVEKGAGAWFSPTMTVREAKAAGKVAVIKAKTDAKVAEINRNAWLEGAEFEEKAYRMMQERALRELANVSAVADKALPQLTEGAEPDAIDDDWMANLVDKVRLCSNGQMQDLWSRVLAREANHAGSFSRRTVNFIADLDPADCVMFTKLCCFHCQLGDRSVDAMPVILNYNDGIYATHGIDFELLTHLDSIGLISLSYPNGYMFEGKRYSFSYFDTELTITIPNGASRETLEFGHVVYTKVGRELVKIAGGTKLPDFLDFIRKRWAHLFNEQVPAT